MNVTTELAGLAELLEIRSPGFSTEGIPGFDENKVALESLARVVSKYDLCAAEIGFMGFEWLLTEDSDAEVLAELREKYALFEVVLSHYCFIYIAKGGGEANLNPGEVVLVDREIRICHTLEEVKNSFQPWGWYFQTVAKNFEEFILIAGNIYLQREVFRPLIDRDDDMGVKKLAKSLMVALKIDERYFPGVLKLVYNVLS